MRLLMADIDECKEGRHSNQKEKLSIKIWLEDSEAHAFAVQAKKHGISDARYVYRALEYAMQDDSWLNREPVGRAGALWK